MRLDQSILAAYYNDARLNILECLNHIREKNGHKRIIDDAEIVSAFQGLDLVKRTPEVQSELIKDLRYRFPFLDALTDAGEKNKGFTPIPKTYHEILLWMFSLLHNLRNTMVHQVDPPVMIDLQLHRKLFFALGDIYDDSRRMVKTRFGWSTQEINKLLRHDGKGKLLPTNRFSFALCADPRSRSNQAEVVQSKVIYDFGHIMFCALFLEKSQSADLINYFWQAGHGKFWPNNDHREMIKEMISVYRLKLPLQRLKADSKTTVTIDALSELSRCPRPLLKTLSPDNQNKFREDIAGEYQNEEANAYLLLRGNQDRFIPLMMNFLAFDKGNKFRFAIDLGHFYYNVRLKPGNRFTDGQSRVRRLGQKLLAYGHLENAIKPPIWQQLEDNFKASSEEAKEASRCLTDDILQLKPYLVETIPHYHFDKQKIGFKLGAESDNSIYPELAVDNVGSNIKLEKFSRDVLEPEFWMSPAQMLHMVFYTHLYNQHLKKHSKASFRSLDVLFKIYQVNITRLFNQLKQETPELSGEAFSKERYQAAQEWLNSFFSFSNGQIFSVSLADIPKVLVKHLLGSSAQNIPKEKILDRAQQILEETEHKLNEVEHLLQAFKKRGHKDFRPIKCGQIGDFLADDFMRFQAIDKSKDDGGKLNSQNYQILQATLAYYGAHIDEPPKIVDLLHDAGLLGGEFAHPFLDRLNLDKNPNQYKGLISFYQAYLKQRAHYLTEYIDKVKASDKIDAANWLRLKRLSSVDGWFKENLNTQGELIQPLPIPKNMLYQPILSLLADVLETSPENIEQQGMQSFTRNNKVVEVRPAISWFVKYYLAEKGDGVQAMYHYPRAHDLFNNYLDNRKGGARFKEKKIHYLTEEQRKELLPKIRDYIATPAEGNKKAIEEQEAKKNKLTRLLKNYKHQEKVLRHTRVQDSLLYLYVREKLDNLLSNSDVANWTLADMENTLLNTAVYHDFSIPKSDKKLYHKSCKIRKLGGLRLLARDRRLPSLLAYYPDKEDKINQAEIRAELVSYRRARVSVLQQVHRLEKLIKAYNVEVPKEIVPKDQQAYFGEGRHGDFLYSLFSELPEKDDKLKDKFNRARLIRNAFSHNEYPLVDSFDSIAKVIENEAIPENPARHRKIALRFSAELEQIYQPWFDFLQNKTKENKE